MEDYIYPLGVIVDFWVVGFSFRVVVSFIKHLAEHGWGLNRLMDCARWVSGSGWDEMLEQLSVYSGLVNQALWTRSQVSRMNAELAKVVGVGSVDDVFG